MARPLALTLGEPAGIGPDLALQVWLRRASLKIPPFYILADADFLVRRAERLGLEVPVGVVTPEQTEDTFPYRLPVSPLGITVTAEPGSPDASSAPAAIAAIRRAVADVLEGKATARRHQPGGEVGALPQRVCRTRSHRIPRQARWRNDPGARAARHDAVVARSGGRSDHHSPAAARRARPPDGRPDRADGPHRRPRSPPAFRHSPSASRRRRAQSARRRGRRDGHRGPCDRCPGGATPAPGRHRYPWSAAGRHDVSRRRAQNL